MQHASCFVVEISGHSEVFALQREEEDKELVLEGVKEMRSVELQECRSAENRNVGMRECRSAGEKE